MLDLEELKYHQDQGVWRYCLSETEEFGDKVAVEKWKYLMFKSILGDVLRQYPSGKSEETVVRAALEQIPSEVQGDLEDPEKVLRITQLDLEYRDWIIRGGGKGRPATLRLRKQQLPGVPLHLANIARNLIQGIGTCEFDIACLCENTEFTVNHLATLTHDDADRPTHFTQLKHGHGHLFSFDLHCNQCDRQHELLDKWVHGWDGFHRRLEFGPTTPDGYPGPTAEADDDYGPPGGILPDQRSFNCPACAGLLHAVHVSIVVDDEYDEFKEHYRDNRSLFKGVRMKDAWNSTFGSIEIALTCSNCDADRSWISCETS